jgi:Tfp pilus assembly protein PilX
MLKRMRKDDETGVVLVTVLLLSMIMLIIVAGTMAYALGSQPLSRRDQDWNAALAAAEAGLDDYLFRLNENDQYYLYSATLLPPDGNLAFTNWVSVPDSGSASVTCTASANSNLPCFRYSVNTANLTAQGAIIITSTGRSRNVTRSVQATLRRHSFIDYLYFTDYETKDPAAYASSDDYTSVQAQTYCAKRYYQGRDISGRTDFAGDTDGNVCTEISFNSFDTINGPLHTNDAIRICGDPVFNGKVTTSWNPATGNKWVDTGGSCGSGPTFTQAGDPKYGDPLTMPPSNVAIKADADGALGGTGCLYTGPTAIVLNSAGTMDVTSPFTLSTNANCLGTGRPLPANGVIYVQNVPSTATDPNYTSGCPYSVAPVGTPTTTTPKRAHPLGYPQQNDITTYGCRNGDVFLRGTLRGRLTIAADNNIDVIGSVTYQSGTGGSDLLGLVANNYAEIYHPVRTDGSTTNCDGGNVNGGCNLRIAWPGQTSLQATALRLPTVQAAILSVAHSFRAQNYNYGDNNPSSVTMTITVNGAIAQKYRGIVTLIGSTGYGKNYNYDNRLKYQSPPHFLTPIAAAWQIVTWIEQKAACAYNYSASTGCP